MELTGRVGQISINAPLAEGSQHPLRLGPQGGLITGTVHSDHFLATWNRHMFSGSTQGGITTSVGFSTTYTGLCLSNPVGSNIVAAINDVTVAFTVAFAAAAAYGLMAGYSATTNVTHTTPVTPKSMYFGTGAAPVCLVDTSATLSATPVLINALGAAGTVAITSWAGAPSANWDSGGSIILPPGAFLAVYTSAASGASGMFASFQWEEVSI